MRFVVKTDVGVVRSENQDRAAVFTKSNLLFAILCDGMGGHKGGSFASSAVVTEFEEAFKRDEITKENVTSWFASTIKVSISKMRKIASEDRSLLDMGTTLTSVFIFNKREAIVFNIGDSRTYFYNGLLQQVTQDHNLRNYYINEYKYSEEEASTIIGAAALTSALGPEKKTTIDSFLIELDERVKYIVLTSDGVHDYIAKELFEAILARNTDIDIQSEELIAKAIKGKSSDNLTNIIIDLWSD